jgi:hypothetical protein
LATYDQLSTEPLAAALWMLVRKQRPKLPFPEALCSVQIRMDCASYRRFAQLSGFHPSS